MNIEVSCFGVLGEVCGTSTVTVRLSGEQASVTDVLDRLCEQYAELPQYLPTTACAVGDELVDRHHRLHEGDTLALLPPVSGG